MTTLPADTSLRDVADRVRRIERLGFDTVHVPETVHDSLAVALLALEHTSRLAVRTSMTLAFPRSPMVIAYAAWDLARFSGGRFQLGIATQVRGNIVGRFSVPWTDPAGRLADYLRSLRAIFAAFADGSPLHHDGKHYRFDRLQPYFNPGPIDSPAPQLWTGGVNRQVCLVAGRLADGFVTHATNSHPRYLRERLLPALTEGAAAAGRRDGGPRVVVVPRCVTAPDADSMVSARDAIRRELAFLYSTPAYRPTLTLLGHQEIGERLTTLVRDGRWAELPGVLPDELLAELLPQGEYAELPAVLAQWYGGLCDGLNVAVPTIDPADVGAGPDTDAAFRRTLEQIREIPDRQQAA
nr:TIGR03617 family F420-dependent LLM class oxidoreductase [Nakamurella lactea]